MSADASAPEQLGPCEACRLWVVKYTRQHGQTPATYGECRRRAPYVVLVRGDAVTRWPETRSDTMPCGSFRPKRAPEAQVGSAA